MLAPAFYKKKIPIPVIKTTASQKVGIEELCAEIMLHIDRHLLNDKRYWLLAEKAFFIIQQKRMKDIDKQEIKRKIQASGSDFNLYRFAERY